LQKECDQFYGNPRGRGARASPTWERDCLMRVSPPFTLRFAGKPLRSIRIHRKCGASLSRVFSHIHEAAKGDQKTIDDWGVSVFGGSYNYRLTRGGTLLSMHAYGCAIDLDPVRNAFHDVTPNFLHPPAHVVVEAFESEGWIWGGRWGGRACDGMHFQAARLV